jgi:hypothetical protein
LSKALDQTSTALNLAMYLLLKCLNSDQDLEVMQSHNRPIISRLQKLNANGEKLEGVEDKADGRGGQLENLVKTAALFTGSK